MIVLLHPIHGNGRTTRRRRGGNGWPLVLGLLAVSLTGLGFGSESGARICVVAVHDSSLFTLCPPSLRESLAGGGMNSLAPPLSTLYDLQAYRRDYDSYQMAVHWDGRMTVWSRPIIGVLVPPAFFPRDLGILERARPDWQKLSRMVTGVCPSGWIDPQMAKEIGAELKKRKGYVLVDSVEKADLVFLVEALYYTYQAAGGGARLHYLLYDSSSGFGAQLRMAAIAIVVPSEIYRAHPADSEALLAARLWEGVSLERFDGWSMPAGSGPVLDARDSFQSASPKELVKKFLNKEKWPADVPPLFAAWAEAPRQRGKAVEVTLGSNEGSAGQPAMSVEKPRAPVNDQVIRVDTTLIMVPVIARE